MNRVRIFACAGAGLALAALGWCLPQADGLSAAMVSRSAGLALLGIAMVAAGLVFRSAMAAAKAPGAPKAALRSSEFRRGFGKGKASGKPSVTRQPTSGDVVVALRRAVAEQAQKPQAMPSGVILPAEEVERLQTMLHNRAAELRARNADQAKRRFLRSGVDIHSLARS